VFLSGLDADDGLQREGVGQVGNGQRVFGGRKWHFFAVDRNTQRFQFFAIENQRLAATAGLRRMASVAVTVVLPFR
jgi:hypothetical protein